MSSHSSSREQLCLLLARAFTDIRSIAYEEKNNSIYMLADLFHIVPHQINKRTNLNNEDCDEILRELYKRADAKQIASWLDNSIESMARTKALSTSQRDKDS
jgi:hypothetical protein